MSDSTGYGITHMIVIGLMPRHIAVRGIMEKVEALMGRVSMRIMAMMAILAMGPMAVGVAQADNGVPAADASSQTVSTPVTDVPGVDCSAVTDWTMLSQCMSATQTGGLVTITATVTVPDGAQTAISKPITLTATTGAATSIETTKLDDTFFVIDQGGSLIIGKDTTDNGFSYKDGKRYFAYVKQGGSLTINNGTFSGIEVPSNGAVAYNAGGTVTINNGTFSGNTAWNGGVVYLQDGSTLSIAGGEFTGNKATGTDQDKNYGPMSGGGVAYGRYASITVTGGTFDGNQAVNGAGGGVFYQFGKGRTLIKGSKDSQIKFSNNVQNPGECTRDAYDYCSAPRAGGGVVFMNEDEEKNQGTLTVQGNVWFDGNGQKSAGLYSGGGAIWARGNLRVKNGIDGTSPKFTNNWAMIFKPSGQADQQIERGGAGGAIFLMMRSTAILTGGVFEDNTSGYLGGAVYTEEDTTTYVGKSVAFGNTAGHFGGGLWFCPSGNSTASKGGNIALYDNTTDPGIDGNPDNTVDRFPANADADADTNQAGADLSIMNPAYKEKGDNQFYLMNTWFTDRSKDAVTWHWDHTPLRKTSGFADSWLIDTNQANEAVWASISMHSSNEVQPEGVITLTKDATPGAFTTGVGFRAEVKDRTFKDKAEKTAQIRFTRNRARMSGGAFGSNGVVVFDTPYSMSWQKVDSSVSPTAPVKTSSTWELSVTLGKDAESGDWLTPYNDDDMRPTDCQVTGETDADCWKVASSTGNSQTWTVDIVDNGRRDNDPGMGSVGLDNLAPGTYTLKEKTAPNGYQKTDNEYTFTIVAVTSDDKSIPKEPNLEYAPGFPKEGDNNLSGDASQNAQRVIGNKPSTGTLEWTKTDDGNKPIGGSQWTLTGPNGTPKFADITDCEVEGQCGTGDGKDMDATPGRFALNIKGTNTDGTWVFPDGNYTLEETEAPEGYWKTTTTYTLTLGTDQSNNRTVTWGDSLTGEFVNKPTIVSWSKVSADNRDKLLPGSEWTITKLDGTGNSSWTVTDCSTEACDTPKDGLKDSDETAGGFTVKNLEPGSYQLEEKTAPEGYAKTDTKYTFTIGTTEGDVTISVRNGSAGEPVKDNKIVNHAIVTALPFTGGRDTRDWYIIGGGIALLGLAAAVAYQRMKRQGVSA